MSYSFEPQGSTWALSFHMPPPAMPIMVGYAAPSDEAMCEGFVADTTTRLDRAQVLLAELLDPAPEGFENRPLVMEMDYPDGRIQLSTREEDGSFWSYYQDELQAFAPRLVASLIRSSLHIPLVAPEDGIHYEAYLWDAEFAPTMAPSLCAVPPTPRRFSGP